MKRPLVLDLSHLNYEDEHVKITAPPPIEFTPDEYAKELTRQLRIVVARWMRGSGMASANTLRKKQKRRTPMLWNAMPLSVRETAEGWAIVMPRRASRYVKLLLKERWTPSLRRFHFAEAEARTPKALLRARQRAARKTVGGAG